MASNENSSQIVSGANLLISIFSALVDEVKMLGGKEEVFQHLASPEGREKIREMARLAVEVNSYPINVDYGESIETVLKAGQYNYWTPPTYFIQDFPTERSGVVDLNIELVCFGEDIPFGDAFKEIDRRGLRFAGLHEILAFGAKYPEVQCKFPLITFSPIEGKDGGRYLFNLERNIDGRVAEKGYMESPKNILYGHCRLVVVKN